MVNTNRSPQNHDRELVEQLKEGSQLAFRELYVRYYDQLLLCCRRYLSDEASAEDIVQDIFMQLWETRDSLNVTSSFGGYIYALARNRIFKMLRQFDIHSRYAQHILSNTKELTEETEISIIEKDYATLLNELIESLPPRQKEIYKLSRIQSLKYKEISVLLHISVETIQEHVSLALKKIKKHLKQHAGIYFKTVIIFLNFL